MSVIKMLSSIIISVCLTTGCTWTKQDSGTAVGAVAGGVVGNVVTGGSGLGTVAGALGGGFVGNRVSR